MAPALRSPGQREDRVCRPRRPERRLGAAPVGHSHYAAARAVDPFLAKAKLDGITGATARNAPTEEGLPTGPNEPYRHSVVATVSGTPSAAARQQRAARSAAGRWQPDAGEAGAEWRGLAGPRCGTGRSTLPETPPGGQTIYVRPEKQAGATTETKLNGPSPRRSLSPGRRCCPRLFDHQRAGDGHGLSDGRTSVRSGMGPSSRPPMSPTRW